MTSLLSASTLLLLLIVLSLTVLLLRLYVSCLSSLPCSSGINAFLRSLLLQWKSPAAGTDFDFTTLILSMFSTFFSIIQNVSVFMCVVVVVVSIKSHSASALSLITLNCIQADTHSHTRAPALMLFTDLWLRRNIPSSQKQRKRASNLNRTNLFYLTWFADCLLSCRIYDSSRSVRSAKLYARLLYWWFNVVIAWASNKMEILFRFVASLSKFTNTHLFAWVIPKKIAPINGGAWFTWKFILHTG